MTQDIATLLGEYLREKGLSEEEIRTKTTSGEMNLEDLRKDFFGFCLGRGAAIKNYRIFESDDFDRLRRVVLSAPDHIDYDEYWYRASALTADMIIHELGLNDTSRILDFGCGVGRVARHVLERLSCRLVGVDISASMLETAKRYVASPFFESLDSATFRADPRAAGPFTAVYALIVLQHCANPEAELRAIREACAPGALLYVLNAERRFVPTTAGWIDDGIDVRKLIEDLFVVERDVDMSDANLRFEPSKQRTADETGHYALVARVP